MIRIEYLKDHADKIPALAELWREVLGKTWAPSVSDEEVRRWMVSWNAQDRLPVGHVAFYGQLPIGVCALQQNDGIRNDLFPWLTDLCVAKAFQRQGVASRLISATQKKAKELGYNNLYLFVFDKTLPAFYQRFDFHTMGEDTFRGHSVIVMGQHL